MTWEYAHIFYRMANKDNMEQDGNKCYKISGSFEFLVMKLDELGAMGWEAAGTWQASNCFILLKRQK